MAEAPADPADPEHRAPDGGGRAAPGKAEFEELFRLHFRSVFFFFRRYRVDAEEARDLVQETFLRAHRGWSGYRGESSAATWLLEIARNLFKNYIRDRNALKKRGIEVPLGAPDPDDDGPPPLELAATDPLSLDLLLDEERKEQLREAIAQLPPQRRQCIELRLQGLPYNEIAVLMGLSIETVKSHLHQAREALKQLLGAGG